MIAADSSSPSASNSNIAASSAEVLVAATAPSGGTLPFSFAKANQVLIENAGDQCLLLHTEPMTLEVPVSYTHLTLPTSDLV